MWLKILITNKPAEFSILWNFYSISFLNLSLMIASNKASLHAGGVAASVGKRKDSKNLQ